MTIILVAIHANLIQFDLCTIILRMGYNNQITSSWIGKSFLLLLIVIIFLVLMIALERERQEP